MSKFMLLKSDKDDGYFTSRPIYCSRSFLV